MSWAEDTKFRLQIAALGLTVMCPIFLIMDAGVNRQRLASRHWPSTPGEIRNVIAKSWFDSDSRKMKFYARAVYNYRVDGQDYTSDLTDLGPGTKRADPQTALADMEQYHSGMKVTVYYDPNNPGMGVLERGIPPLQLGLLVALCVLTVICGISSFFILRGWLRSIKLSRAKKPPSQNLPTEEQ